ncbi:PQQ-dependent sugar dehydrogenase [Psychrobacter sp. WY6]|nr:PQQ-dependent sugar dehydrogenase [Psychrobacter sp. WY6]
MSVNLGKIIRLNLDGSVPADNPFVDNSNDIAAQFWTIGHRNVLGMAFDEKGRLWAHEMGPRGGDEFNLIEKGYNYGWPIVSNGRNYTGTDIPDHETRPEFTPPKISWTPVISPSSMSIYNAGQYNDFPAWQGNALISGLSSKALIVVDFDENSRATERYRYDMGERIRSVLNVDGQVWVLEDGDNSGLLQLTPQ